MENNQKQKSPKHYREMLLLKGIGSELEKMAYPKIGNLKSMLETMGYTIVPKNQIQEEEVEENTEEEEKGGFFSWK